MMRLNSELRNLEPSDIGLPEGTRLRSRNSGSGNMQQIYRKTPMPKCDFNKVPKNTSGWLLLKAFHKPETQHYGTNAKKCATTKKYFLLSLLLVQLE